MSIYKHFSSKLRALVVFFVLHFLAVTGCMPSFRRHTLGVPSCIHMQRINAIHRQKVRSSQGFQTCHHSYIVRGIINGPLLWTRTSTINYPSITSFCCQSVAGNYPQPITLLILKCVYFISSAAETVQYVISKITVKIYHSCLYRAFIYILFLPGEFIFIFFRNCQNIITIFQSLSVHLPKKEKSGNWEYQVWLWKAKFKARPNNNRLLILINKNRSKLI